MHPLLGLNAEEMGVVQNVTLSEHMLHATLKLLSPFRDEEKHWIDSITQALQSALPGRAIKLHAEPDLEHRIFIRSQDPPVIPNVGQVIAVSSGKGGVGKSTVSVNLALGLMLKGARVGILDADFHGPNVPSALGMDGSRESVEIQNDRLLPATVNQIKVMSWALLMEEDRPLLWRGPMLARAVKQLTREVEWGRLDYLIVDLPPGTGDVALSLIQEVPLAGVVLVTTPHALALEDVRRAVTFYRQSRIPILGLVENMAYFETPDEPVRKYAVFGESGESGAAARFARETKLQFLASLPLLPAPMPSLIQNPNHRFSKQIQELAGEVARQALRSVHSPVDPRAIVTLSRPESD